jgi:hypothetical protein
MMIGAAESNRESLPKRLAATMKRQPRQTALLSLLILVLGFLWIKMMLGDRLASPAAATAAMASIEPGILPQPDAGVAGSPPRHAPGSLAEWAQQQTAQLGRNLFAVPFNDYPPDPAHPAPTTQMGKSDPSDADQTRERQALVESVRADAAKLTLEGIVLGASPRIWVNGSLVGVGQSVGETGFKVVQIEARRVFVERGGVRIELTMK